MTSKIQDVSLICLIFLVLFLHNILLAEIEFGEKVEPIQCTDIRGNYLSVPNNCSVSVLFFFNTENGSHFNIIEKLNSLFIGLQEQKKNVSLYLITKSETDILMELSDKYKLKVALINDLEEKFSSQFNYKCGVCVKVAILDKKNTIRYLAEHIDLDFIKSVVEQYESNDKDQINPKPGEKK